MTAAEGKGKRRAAKKSFPTLDQKLCFSIYSCSLAMLKSYKGLLAVLGLTYPQYLVMLVLWEQEAVSLKFIADRLGLDSPSVTPVVKRLEEAGYLTRRRDDFDERNLRVELTAEGRALQVSAEEASHQFVLSCDMSQADGGELRERLTELAATLRRTQTGDA